MFGFLKNNRKNKKVDLPALIDLNGNKLIAGDMVISYRYDLGKCKVVDGAQGLEYESLSSHKKVNYTLMIDAVTQRQKVEKIDS
ncbi:MAG: hypothetical protein HC819_08290 [Cyclobacteriaceae bacterium]|nr:hypothetical protein [Cyclobacteriaceae bacterium]